MKKARLDIKINVPDDFQCGDCKNCPLRIEEVDTRDRTELRCSIHFDSVTCPLDTNDSLYKIG